MRLKRCSRSAPSNRSPADDCPIPPFLCGSSPQLKGWQAIGDELGAKDEEEHRHNRIVVLGKPVLHVVQASLRLRTAEQVIDDRPGDRDAGQQNEDDQRDDRTTANVRTSLIPFAKSPTPRQFENASALESREARSCTEPGHHPYQVMPAASQHARSAISSRDRETGTYQVARDACPPSDASVHHCRPDKAMRS
jgi:hypothetical protein